MSGSDTSSSHLEAPIEYYIQGALAFHQQSCYGAFPEPQHPALTTPPAPPVQQEPDEQSIADISRLSQLAAVLQGRRSQRQRGRQVDLHDLESCLGTALGRQPDSDTFPYPSAGSTYTVTAFCILLDMADGTSGVYLFNATDNRLERLALPSPDPAEGEGELLRTTVLNSATAQAIVVLTTDMACLGARYGERSYRYALIEAGHMGQNLLTAFALAGVGACPIGGIHDAHVAQAVGLVEATELCLYAIAVP